MKPNVFIYLLCINMLFFAVFNLPVYKFLCNININYFNTTCLCFFYDLNFCFLPAENLFFFFTNTEKYYNFCFFFSIRFFILELSNCNNFSNLIMQLYIDTTIVNAINIDFFPLQNKLYLIQLETNLIFFRMYNSNFFNITGISIYMISPIEYWFCVNKIQCFCFEKILIHAEECIDLPVLFFFHNINDYITHNNSVYINYVFFPDTYSSTVERIKSLGSIPNTY